MTEKTCDNCDGMCCKHVAMEIDNPETIDDFENIRWYVLHKNINVYVDEDYQWHIEFLTPCEFLGKDNKCEIYEKRPTICREYNTDECPFHNHYEEKFNFKNLEEVDKYIKEVFETGKHVIIKEVEEVEEDENEIII